MLKPKKMVKIGVVCPNNVLDKVINQLYDMKVIEIEDYSKDNEFDIGTPLPNGEELAELTVKLKSIASNAEINFANDEYDQKNISLDEIKKEINLLYENIKEKVEFIEFYKKIIDILKNESYVKALKETIIDAPRARDKESLFYCGLAKKDIEKEIKEFSKTYNILTKDIDGAKLTLLFVPKSKKKLTENILEKNLFVGLDKKAVKNNLINVSASFIDKKSTLPAIMRFLKQSEHKLSSALKTIKEEKENLILNANDLLSKETEKSHAPLKFAATKHIHIISGYVPQKKFETVKKTLEEHVENKVHVHKIKLEKDETAPVFLDNPQPAKQFQFLLDLYALPKYAEIDPTIFLFFTFPIFFGFMLGDIGYGFLTLALFIYLKHKLKFGKALLNMLIISSLATIIFGAVFGEIFGEEVIFGYHLPHLLSRVHQIGDLLSISIIIGIVHVLFGLILGFINVRNMHGLKHAVYEKLGWILLFPLLIWGLVDFVGVISGRYAELFIPLIPSFPIIGVTSFLGIILIIKSEGINGIIELPSIFSNILSYARLMAIGLASAELAIIINHMAKEMFIAGGLSIIFGILTIIIGHSINLALGILGPFLHSLRLHYVEYFSKFYVGGGKRFIPFGEKIIKNN